MLLQAHTISDVSNHSVNGATHTLIWRNYFCLHVSLSKQMAQQIYIIIFHSQLQNEHFHKPLIDSSVSISHLASPVYHLCACMP